MALIFCDSFDNYNSPAIGILGKWQSSSIGASTLTIAAGSGRNGTAALSFVASGNNSGLLQWVNAAGSLGSIIVGVAINVTSFDVANETPFLAFVDTATTQVTVSFLSNGAIRFRSGAGIGGTILSTSNAAVLTASGSFFYLEFQFTFNSATGAITLHANGANVALSASSGLNTAPSGNNSFNTLQLGRTANVNSVANYLFDDFYIVSTSGGANTTFLGDVRVACVFPNGAGSSTQFTPNGAATNWQCVNETSEDGDTTYVASQTALQKDLYTKQATPATTGPIFGVQFCSVARKDDAGTRSIANTWLSGGTAQDGATKALNQTYTWYLDIAETDPNTGVAWTKTGFDAAQQGAKVAV